MGIKPLVLNSCELLVTLFQANVNTDVINVLEGNVLKGVVLKSNFYYTGSSS